MSLNHYLKSINAVKSEIKFASTLFKHVFNPQKAGLLLQGFLSREPKTLEPGKAGERQGPACIPARGWSGSSEELHPLSQLHSCQVSRPNTLPGGAQAHVLARRRETIED